MDLMTTRSPIRVISILGTTVMFGGVALASPLSATASAPTSTTKAADFGVGMSACPQTLAQSHSTREVGWLLDMGDGTSKFRPGERTKLPWRAAPTSAWLSAPSHEGATYQHTGLHVLVDGKGSGAVVRDSENGQLDQAILVRGPWKGLRLLATAGDTGDRESAAGTRSTLLYAVDTRGRLVRMPISWTAKGLPVVGKQQVIGSGFGQVVGLELSFWRHRNDVPTEDHLSGITRSGAFVEWTVTGGNKPTVRARTLAKSGYSGVTGFRSDSCLTDGRMISWVISRSNGTHVSYIDT